MDAWRTEAKLYPQGDAQSSAQEKTMTSSMSNYTVPEHSSSEGTESEAHSRQQQLVQKSALPVFMGAANFAVHDFW